jgi:hypothetical protein
MSEIERQKRITKPMRSGRPWVAVIEDNAALSPRGNSWHLIYVPIPTIPYCLGPSNGTDDTTTIQAALTACRLAGVGIVKGTPGVTYVLAGNPVIGSYTTWDLTGCGIAFTSAAENNMLRNYSYVNPVATASDGAVNSGSSVVSTSLAASASIGQTLVVVGAGGTGNGPMVGNIVAIDLCTRALGAINHWFAHHLPARQCSGICRARWISNDYVRGEHTELHHHGRRC